MSDFNIDIKNKRFSYVRLRYVKLDTSCDLFNLKNIIHSETCLMKYHKSTTDFFLISKPYSIFKTCTTETGLSNYNKLIYTFFKSKKF